MNILLTNDDGIYAPGLESLYKHLASRHSVSIIAPDREQSAVGHGITLNKPLRVHKVSVNNAFKGYAVSGTPADCIKMGILEILDVKPDMVISGINPGANVGVNINYSGTVAAAKEAALYGILAIAVSIHSRDVLNYDEAALFVETLAKDVYAHGLPPGTFLNVNIPNRPLKEIAGVRISRLDMDFFPEYIDKRMDPRERTYYWQGCDSLPAGKSTDIDGSALCEDFISITPIKCDQTDYQALENLKGWKPDGVKALNEIRRVLKPSGRFVLVDIDYPRDGNWLGIQSTKLWMSLGDIIRNMDALFKQTGFQFTDDEVGGFGSIHLYIATKEDFHHPNLSN